MTGAVPGGRALREDCTIISYAEMLGFQEELAKVIAKDFNASQVETLIPSLELEAKSVLARSLPRVGRELGRLGKQKHGMFWLKGLSRRTRPVSTFYDGVVRAEEIPVELMSLLGTMSSLGLSLVGYSRKNRGRILRSVAPTETALGQLGSQGSARELPLHIDNADLFFPEPFERRHYGRSISARYIGWVVINADSQAPMEYTFVDDAVSLHEYERDIEVLQQPLFDAVAPDSIGKETANEMVPLLLRESDGGFISRFHAAKIRPRGFDARIAFDRFSLTVKREEILRRLFVQSGDVVILDNFKALHGRKAFWPRRDGTDRQMIRVYGMDSRDLSQVAHSMNPEYPNSRIMLD
jgi:L-asparagine oxygenase